MELNVKRKKKKKEKKVIVFTVSGSMFKGV